MIFASSLLSNCWEFSTRHPGISLVLLGVAGEVVFDWKEMKGRLAWAKRLSALVLIAGLILEFSEAAKTDKLVAATQLRVEQLRKENDKQLHKGLTFDPARFHDSLNGKPKMDVSILFAPNDEGSWWLAHNLEMELGIAGWRIVDFRAFREDDDITQVKDEYGWKNMPLSMRLDAPLGRISLGISGQEKNFGALGAVETAINSFAPEILALPRQHPDPRLSTNVLQIIVGPGF